MSSQACFVSSAATSLVTTAETAVLTFTTAPENQPTGQGLYIDANCIVTTGAAATALQVRVRQGAGTAGAIVGVVAQSQCAASTADELASCAALDPTTNYPAGNTYTVTVQQVAATGNGTMAQVTASVAPVTALMG
jgi:hypothetical protein